MRARIFRITAFAAAGMLMLAVSGGLAGQAKRPHAKASATPDSAAEGRQTFAAVCSSCHGLDGKGGERGPDIATRPEVTRLPDEDLRRIVSAGIPGKGMPPFGDLGATKLSFLLSYLRSLQGKGAPVEVSGNAETGKELFWGKAGCSECHMVSGRGGFLGPDLSSYGESHSVKEMEAAIVNPERKAGPRRVGAEVTTKDGNVYSGLVRNEDNFSMQLQARDGTFHLLSKSELAAIHYQSQSLMPTDYGTKLTAEELNNLVAYLARSAKGKSDPGEKY